MSKALVALLIAVVVAGNAVTITLLVRGRGSGPESGVARSEREDARAPLLEAITALREDLARLASQMAARPEPAAAAAGGREGKADDAPGGPAAGARPAGIEEVIERLERLETALTAMKDVKEELAAAKLRAMREEEFRAEDGYTLADELLAQKQFAVAANGILTFLDAHPDHPDARDLMTKARDAFLEAGYGDKALWLQEEIMKKSPESRGADLRAS
jgi:hypothetical protein